MNAPARPRATRADPSTPLRALRVGVLAALLAVTGVIGCATFRDSRFEAKFSFPAPSPGAQRVALELLNRFIEPKNRTDRAISTDDRDAFAAAVEGAYRDSRLFSSVVTQPTPRQEPHETRPLVVENELSISENLHPKPSRVLNTFLFTWLDRRRVTVRAIVRSHDGRRLGEFAAAEEYETIGFFLLPVMPLLGRSERTVKDEVFRALVVRIINAAQRDGLFTAPDARPAK